MTRLTFIFLGESQYLLPSGASLDLPARKLEVLLAYLALNPGIQHSRDKLTNLLWSSRSEVQARNSLRQALSTIKKSLSTMHPLPIKIDRTTVMLDSGSIHVDAHEFMQLAAESDIESLSKAATLYDGEFLKGLSIQDSETQDWLAFERNRFKDIIIDVLLKLSHLQLSDKDYKSAIKTTERLLELDPLVEKAWRYLMKAYDENCDRNHALHAYKRCQNILYKELGVEPEIKTSQLRDQIKTGKRSTTDNADQVNKETKMGCQVDPLAQKEIGKNNTVLVLPFKNLSGEIAQDYFCDGLTEDIISQLSRFRDLFVIAETSSFFYKNKQMRIQDIAAELGVRYLVEGSVQKLDGQIRISAQLLEGDTGRHLWSENYDRRLDDGFKLQDEVTQMIVGSLASVYGGRIRKAWQCQNKITRPKSSQAYDYFMQGINAVDEFTKQANQQGREFFKKAIRLDPGYAKAYSKLSWTYILDAIEGWDDDYQLLMEKGYEYANKAIKSDDSEAWSYWPLAAYYIYTHQHEKGMDAFKKALNLNPNDADILTDAGYYFNYAGKTREGLDFAQKAIQLNPHFPDYYILQMIQILFDARQYRSAISIQRKVHRSETTLSNLYMATSHAGLGQTVQARNFISRVVKMDPQACVKKWTQYEMAPYKNTKDLEHFRSNLILAGLPK